MKYLVIDRRVVRNNLKAIKERAEGAAIYVDLKRQRRRMGLLEIAKLLRDMGSTPISFQTPKTHPTFETNGFTEEKLMMLKARRIGRAGGAH